jgi:hypothetical protein
MRTIVALLTLCAAITARAQTSPTASTTVNQGTGIFTPSRMDLIYMRPQKPNEVRFDRTSVDGILVDFGKRENPLQLINPAAPLPYTSMDNVVLDPITQNVTGWKLFSISF